MTISYPNGTIVEALLRLRSQDELHATVAGCDDVLAFRRIHGTWISQEIEPVIISLGSQGRMASRTSSEEARPNGLPNGYFPTLFGGHMPHETVANTLYLSSLI